MKRFAQNIPIFRDMRKNSGATLTKNVTLLMFWTTSIQTYFQIKLSTRIFFFFFFFYCIWVCHYEMLLAMMCLLTFSKCSITTWIYSNLQSSWHATSLEMCWFLNVLHTEPAASLSLHNPFPLLLRNSKEKRRTSPLYDNCSKGSKELPLAVGRVQYGHTHTPVSYTHLTLPTTASV